MAKGLYLRDTVVINVSLKKGLEAGIIAGQQQGSITKNGISLLSVGKESDKLLASMGKPIWGQISSQKAKKAEVNLSLRQLELRKHRLRARGIHIQSMHTR